MRGVGIVVELVGYHAQGVHLAAVDGAVAARHGLVGTGAVVVGVVEGVAHYLLAGRGFAALYLGRGIGKAFFYKHHLLFLGGLLAGFVYNGVDGFYRVHIGHIGVAAEVDAVAELVNFYRVGFFYLVGIGLDMGVVALFFLKEGIYVYGRVAVEIPHLRDGGVGKGKAEAVEQIPLGRFELLTQGVAGQGEA